MSNWGTVRDILSYMTKYISVLLLLYKRAIFDFVMPFCWPKRIVQIFLTLLHSSIITTRKAVNVLKVKIYKSKEEWCKPSFKNTVLAKYSSNFQLFWFKQAKSRSSNSPNDFIHWIPVSWTFFKRTSRDNVKETGHSKFSFRHLPPSDGNKWDYRLDSWKGRTKNKGFVFKNKMHYFFQWKAS